MCSRISYFTLAIITYYTSFYLTEAIIWNAESFTKYEVDKIVKEFMNNQPEFRPLTPKQQAWLDSLGKHR